jgi:hypothetical protein
VVVLIVALLIIVLVVVVVVIVVVVTFVALFSFHFVHLFSVNLLQDMEIVVLIIILKNSSIQYIHTKFVRNLCQCV